MRVAVELAQQLLVHPYVVVAADRPTEVEPHATAARWRGNDAGGESKAVLTRRWVARAARARGALTCQGRGSRMWRSIRTRSAAPPASLPPNGLLSCKAAVVKGRPTSQMARARSRDSATCRSKMPTPCRQTPRTTTTHGRVAGRPHLSHCWAASNTKSWARRPIAAQWLRSS